MRRIANVSLSTTRRQRIGIISAILIGYWIIMEWVPVPGTGAIGATVLNQPDKTLAAWSDRAILGVNHILSSTRTWEPEGPLSTLPAIATVLLGVLAGEWITSKRRPLVERVLGLYGAGCVAMGVGELWGCVFPINKNLWTSSYAVFTVGFACVALATCIFLIDVMKLQRWTKPFVICGVNPLTAFVGSALMTRVLGQLVRVSYRGNRVGLQESVYQAYLEPHFPPKLASLLWAIGFVAFWLGVLWVLFKRKIVLKL